MGLMILPIIASLSEDAMHAVPRGLREGAYALGGTRLRTASCRWCCRRPSRASRRRSSSALSRAIGETMIVAIAAGQQPRFTADPRVPVETMTAYIVQVSLGDTPAGHARVPDHLRGGPAALPHDVRAQPARAGCARASARLVR
jgi:phosphate transport system permease protein